MSGIKTRTDLSYSERNSDSGDDIINVNINWENGNLESLQTNLNTWLRSIGVPLKVIAETGRTPETSAHFHDVHSNK